MRQSSSMSRRSSTGAHARWVFCAVLAGCAWSVASAKELSPAQWNKKNVPIVRKYLLSLKPAQVGSTLPGVKLSDGTFRLKGQTFLADVSSKERGLHAYKFRTALDDQKYEIHYLWVDKGFKPVDLKTFPWCAGEWLEPSGRTGIDGEEYGQSEISPGGNIVVTTCQLRAPKLPGQKK